MEDFDPHTSDDVGPTATVAEADPRLRLITLAKGNVWPARDACELVLVLSCRSNGFEMPGLDDRLYVGEVALLPLGNGLLASAHGRVLSARLDRVAAPSAPQRLRDRLIALLLRRAWASSFTAEDILNSTLDLVDLLAASRARALQEHFDMLERLDPRFARVINYIDAHLGESLSVGGLADIANLSPSQFSRKFKESIGEPVWNYVTRRRCERAMELLQCTDQSISRIAHCCGFANQSHFTNTIKSHFGVTPTALRSDS